ncbi:MAG: arginase [Acidimicrobiia bacterium]|nr:arginase [Acidimicrobiia bacterium]
MLASHPRIEIIGAPQDLGQSLRGVDMGPSAIRVAGLVERLRGLGFDVVDHGDLTCSTMALSAEGDARVRFADEVAADAEQLADVVADIAARGSFPLVLGGDHGVAIGTVGGLARHERRQAIVWVDAHGDFNVPETSPSGNVHGMPLAAILGDGDRRLVEACGVSPKALATHTVIIGLRDVDPGEAERLRKAGIRRYTMRDIDERGIRPIMDEVVAYVTRDGVDRVHLSFDMDALDPRHAPGTGTPVRGGLTYREGHLMMELLADADVVTSAEFVEVNPALDERNRTAEMAVELVASLAGQQIL